MKMITINGNLSEYTLLRNVEFISRILGIGSCVLLNDSHFFFFPGGGFQRSVSSFFVVRSHAVLLTRVVACDACLPYGYCSTSASCELVLTQLLTSFRTSQKPALPLSSLIAPQRAPFFKGASFKPQEANRPL